MAALYIPPPEPQLYELGKARQEDREAEIELRQELHEAREAGKRGPGGLWRRLRALLGLGR